MEPRAGSILFFKLKQSLIKNKFNECKKPVYHTISDLFQFRFWAESGNYSSENRLPDNPTPEFSWILPSTERGILQTAYEIYVADDLKKLDAGNCWHSGKVSSNNTFGIWYAGKPLQSFTRYFWKVRVWNQKGEESEWSQQSWFETSMMKPSDWKAQWISDQRALPEKIFLQRNTQSLASKGDQPEKGSEIGAHVHCRIGLFHCLPERTTNRCSESMPKRPVFRKLRSSPSRQVI